MIYKELQRHWAVCQALRNHAMPEMRPHALGYFWGRCDLRLSPLETKAIGFVTEIGDQGESPYFVPID